MDKNISNNKENNLPVYFFPMLVSSRKGFPDSEKEFLLKWEKFDALSEKIKKILNSEKVSDSIKKISDDFNFNPKQSEEISRLIRDVFFGNIKQENVASELAQKISLNGQQAQSIAQEIKNKIFLFSPQENYLPEQNISIIKLPILEALKKYPDLGRQRISANDIKLKIFPDPVTPSIKNWIADYRQFMGTRDYEAVEKSRYLFQSENTKKLNSQELQKLSLVLKSLDDHIPLTINAQDQQIIFPPFKVKEEMPKIAYSARGDNRIEVAKTAPEGWKAEQQNKNDAGSFRFSSPQTFESEREKKEKLNENKSKDSHYYQIYPMGIKTDNEENKARAKKNVVNLKENF